MDKKLEVKIKIKKDSMKSTSEMNKYFIKEFSILFSKNLKIPIQMYQL